MRVGVATVCHTGGCSRQSTTVAVWSKIGALQMPRRLEVPFEPTSLQNAVVALDMDPGAALLVDYAELYGLLQMHAGSSLAGWM